MTSAKLSRLVALLVPDLAPIRVVLVHNYYQQQGGEDRVFAAEARLLENHGDDVIRYTVDNDCIDEMSAWEVGRKTIWNSEVYSELRRVIRATRPTIVHAHNIFPLISPAAYAAARAEGVPVVQTLHNYRLLCANSLMFRDGKVCEDCLHRLVMWPAVWHRCYRHSGIASAVVVAMLHYHRWRGTWRDQVDVFIALTEFARRKLISGGLPADKVLVKPNFVESAPGPRNGLGDYILFVGRLATGKGVRTLLEAWKSTPDLPPLLVVGDGPLREEVQSAALRTPQVRWLGRRSPDEVRTLLGNARALAFPSEWYEGLPLVIIEAYAAGVPVIGAAIGAAASLIEPGQTGIIHTPGDPYDLAAQVRWAWRHPREMLAMGAKALERYQERFTGTANYLALRGAYARAEKNSRRRKGQTGEVQGGGAAL